MQTLCKGGILIYEIEIKEIFNKLKITRQEALEIEETKYWNIKTRNFKDYVIDIEN